MSNVGNWGRDINGLPHFNYTGAYPAIAKDRIGRDSRQESDPCFILGNYKINVFAHASGIYELISGERGWARLNNNGVKRGWNQTTVTVETTEGKASYDLIDKNSDEWFVKAQRFGAGYARYDYALPEGLSITRVISTKPSGALHKGNSSILMSVLVKNDSEREMKVSLCEQLLSDYRMMSAQNEGTENPNHKIRYKNSIKACNECSLVTSDIAFEAAKLFALPINESEAFPYDCFPPILFMKALDGGDWSTTVGGESREIGDVIFTDAVTTLAPGQEKRLELVIGFDFTRKDGAIGALVDDMLCGAEDVRSCPDGAYSKLWKDFLPDFSDEADDIMRDEMVWNAYTLEVIATYNAYFDETYIPQGSVYAYTLGQNASVRDHAQHMMPMIYENPALAKSCIRFILKHSKETGEIQRQSIGYGFCDYSGYRESDPQLYLFMSLGEYLRVTKDYSILEERIPCYPVESGTEDSIIRMLVKCFTYLRDDIGRGKHKLVRMLRSDWSDSFFMTPGINYRAESHMNTTMALCMIPTLVDALEAYAPKSSERELTLRLIAEMKQYRSELYEAFMADMEDKTFSPRCYLGDKDEDKIGVDNMCVEPQIFLMQMKDYPVERKKVLWGEIKDRILGMEKIGARTREKPLHHEDGHGEDGGIWFSHQGPLMVGVSSIDRDGALEMMRNLTFHNFAKHYPDYWMGQWSAADSLESTLNDREGLYFFWTFNAFQPFCAHAHAWMLYCYYRIWRCEK